ncbi:MAG: hypothetical protein GYB30_05720 [Gammaproteobacteria bacterium]|nr:hypothetical protein [Gammaproteobacteria bacterium]
MFSFTENRLIVDGTKELRDKFDIGFIGSPLDIRGKHSISLIKQISKTCKSINYNHMNHSVTIDGTTIPLLNLNQEEMFGNAVSVVVDATNLAFPELAILLRFLLKTARVWKVSFIYSEPQQYTKSVYGEPTIHYELSDNIEPPQFVPSFYSFNRSRTKHLFAFLGFESRRFIRMVDPDDGEVYGSVNPIFAVPPYQPGFEKISFDENSRVLEKSSNSDCFFVPSNHPYSALKLLRETYDTYKKLGEDLVVAPLGNKPCTIATAMAAAENERISVLFDFPTKRSNRSSGVEKVYLFTALINK